MKIHVSHSVKFRTTWPFDFVMKRGQPSWKYGGSLVCPENSAVSVRFVRFCERICTVPRPNFRATMSSRSQLETDAWRDQQLDRMMVELNDFDESR